MKQYIRRPSTHPTLNCPLNSCLLIEDMARNVHMKCGPKTTWPKAGPTAPCDDAAKHHPCLVDYDSLPDSEKEYDRATSQETLKCIIKLGFNITNNPLKLHVIMKLSSLLLGATMFRFKTNAADPFAFSM